MVADLRNLRLSSSRRKIDGRKIFRNFEAERWPKYFCFDLFFLLENASCFKKEWNLKRRRRDSKWRPLGSDQDVKMLLSVQNVRFQLAKFKK